MRSLMICTVTKYCWGNKIEKNEMGEAIRIMGGEEKRIQVFGGEI
jgi:hypothetical protein